MKKMKFEYIGIGVLIIIGALASISKYTKTGNNPYAQFKKDYKLTMSEAEIENYMKMTPKEFDEQIENIVKNNCGTESQFANQTK